MLFRNLLHKIDAIIDHITMYRLVLYYLIFLLAAAAVLGGIGKMAYTPVALLFSAAVLVAASYITNEICAKVLRVPTNVESVYITAFILTLIIAPPTHANYTGALPFLIWAAVLAMASKYVINIRHKHLFNPAALAVALTALALNRSASWWIGTLAMLPFVLVGGLVVIRKVRRFGAVIPFTAAAVIAMTALAGRGVDPLYTVYRSVVYSPLIFFAAVMLTEPLTMPPTRDGRIAYGILVGWLFAPQTHFGSLYFTPELALLAGNIFSYLISPKGRHVMKLKEKREASAGVYDFVFESDRTFPFKPGQYMEWTLGHDGPDSRGNRRYFTIASSPTEPDVLLGVKFYENPSTFKQHMRAMNPGDVIFGGQLAGDFTLPRDSNEKLMFIAGGIGITPFRSMLKYLSDNNEKRAVTMLYSCRSQDEIAYQDVLYEASQKFGASVYCTLTDNVPVDWSGFRGYINADMIRAAAPDFNERTFYISGSHSMVTACKEMLLSMGVPRRKIKTDFFPGLV